jgi:hypothetical protein
MHVDWAGQGIIFTFVLRSLVVLSGAYQQLIMAYPVESGEFVNLVAGVKDHSKTAWEGPWVKSVSQETLVGTFEGWDHRATNLLKVIVLLSLLA